MRSLRHWLGTLTVGSLLALGGCTSSSPTGPMAFPWGNSMTARTEEYRVPPMEDSRFSDPQSLPKSVMKPTIQPKDTTDLARRPPRNGMSGPGGPGMGAF